MLPTAIARLAPGKKGAYILEFRIECPLDLTVGRLGRFRLGPGWYYYVGSARSGLRARLRRHILGPSKRYWHVDYLSSLIAPVRAWFVLSKRELESAVAEAIASKAHPAVPRFGCGDSPKAVSHLFFSRRRRNFLDHLRAFGPASQVRIL